VLPNRPLTYKEANELVDKTRADLERKIDNSGILAATNIDRAEARVMNQVNGFGMRLDNHIRESDQRFARNEERAGQLAEQGAHTSGTERVVLMLLAALVSALMGLALKSVGTKTIVEPQPTITATVTATPTARPQSAPAVAPTGEQVAARAVRPTVPATSPPKPPAPRPTPTVTVTPIPIPPGLLQSLCHLLKDPRVLCKGKTASRRFPLLLLPLSMIRRKR
jgi:hypothetical protein